MLTRQCMLLVCHSRPPVLSFMWRKMLSAHSVTCACGQVYILSRSTPDLYQNAVLVFDSHRFWE
jgi:hypothetical protein